MKIGPGKSGQKNQQILASATVVSWLWIGCEYFAYVTHTSKDPPWAPLKGSVTSSISYLISNAQKNLKVTAKKSSLFPGVSFFKQHFYFIKMFDYFNVYKIRIFAKGLKSLHKKVQLIKMSRLAYRRRESYDSNFGNRKSRPGYPYRALSDWSKLWCASILCLAWKGPLFL